MSIYFFSYVELQTFNPETTDDRPSAPLTLSNVPPKPLEPPKPPKPPEPSKPPEPLLPPPTPKHPSPLEPHLALATTSPLAHNLYQEPPGPPEPLAPTKTSLTPTSPTLPAAQISKSEIIVSLKKRHVTKLETGLISDRNEE